MPAPEEYRHRVNPDDLDEIDGLFVDAEGLPAPAPQASPIAHIVAVVSPMEGTGKTSIAILLAGMLAAQGRRPLLVDLDPRGRARAWAQAGRGLPFPVHEFEAGLGAAAFRRAMLDALRAADLLVLDTPPDQDAARHLALQIADLVLVPVGASNLDLAAMQEIIAAAREARHGELGDLPALMVVPARLDAGGPLARDLSQRLALLTVSVAPTIGQHIEVAAAARGGRLVRPGSLAGKQFRSLAHHVWAYLESLESRSGGKSRHTA